MGTIFWIIICLSDDSIPQDKQQDNCGNFNNHSNNKTAITTLIK